jgi:adenine-specific DNA-methyltransferase
LFTKDDIEEMEIPIKACKAARFAGMKYYALNHLGPTLDSSIGEKKRRRHIRLGDVVYIGNGLVSGLDKAFRVGDRRSYSNIEKEKFIRVVKAYDLHQYYISGYTPYIFVNSVLTEEKLKTIYPNIFSKLLEYKKNLEQRYSYNKDIPWWHWVFLRNWDLFNNNEEKIFCPCKERIDNKKYARFSYVKGEFLPTQDVTAIIRMDWIRESIKYILAILNSNMMLKWMKCEGLLREGVLEFSERPLSKIPIRLIDWSDENEVRIHDKIVEIVDIILEKKEIGPYKKEIENLLNQLLVN